MAETSGSDGTVIDITATSSSESRARGGEREVRNIPCTCTLFITFHTPSVGTVDRTGDHESYESHLTAGALSHTLFPIISRLSMPCQSIATTSPLVLPADFRTRFHFPISPFPHFSISSLLISSLPAPAFRPTRIQHSTRNSIKLHTSLQTAALSGLEAWARV